MSRRAARFTQCDLERAMRAADAHRARSGAAWRVRIEVDGTIVLEPMPPSGVRGAGPERADLKCDAAAIAALRQAEAYLDATYGEAEEDACREKSSRSTRT